MSQSQPSVTGSPQPQQMNWLQRLELRLWGQAAAPKWDPKLKRLGTRLRIYILVMCLLVITGVVVGWAIGQPVEAAPIRPLPQGVDLAIILAPVLAAAAGIERFLETLFCILEGYAKTLVAYLGRGMRWLHNAETEVDQARQWLATVSSEYTRQLQSLPTFAAASGEPSKDSKDIFKDAQDKLQSAKNLLALAERRLDDAEKQLDGVTSSDGYRNAKRAFSIYLGLLLGVVVATASSLQMFAMLGVKVGDPKVDVIITGLVIGSGSTPVHSLINILQSAKDTLESTQDWLDANKFKKEDRPAATY